MRASFVSLDLMILGHPGRGCKPLSWQFNNVLSMKIFMIRKFICEVNNLLKEYRAMKENFVDGKLGK